MTALNLKQTVELGDLVIASTNPLLGKMAYRVIRDVLYIKLENIENGFEYEKVFLDLDELQSFIESHSHIFQLIPLH